MRSRAYCLSVDLPPATPPFEKFLEKSLTEQEKEPSQIPSKFREILQHWHCSFFFFYLHNMVLPRPKKGVHMNLEHFHYGVTRRPITHVRSIGRIVPRLPNLLQHPAFCVQH